MPGFVSLVGAGPGDPGLLTLKGARALAGCDVVVYDALAAPAVVATAPPSAERIYVGKRAREHTLAQEEITALLVRLGREGRRVVRLKGGDVFVFGRGAEEAQALAQAGVAFEIVPGITSAIAAPAYAGIPVTHRDHNTAFTVATGHEDPTKPESTLDFAKLANPAATTIFLMAMGNLAEIVARLRANGLGERTPAAVVQDGTTPRQRVVVGTLATIVDDVARDGLAAPAIVVIGEVVRERERLRWFDAGPLFGKRVLITRPAHQAAAFAQALWELGAEPIVAPTIAIGPPDDPAAAVAAVDRVRDYAWVAFTSRNGVEAFFARLAHRQADARALADARVAAIGPATADALAEHGVRADAIPPSFVGEAVADELLVRTTAGDRILLFRAQEGREVIPAVLRRAGRLVDDVAGYAMRPIDDPTLAERAADADIVTFTSRGTIVGFIRSVPDAVGLLRDRTVACIGPVTAAAARDAGIRVDVVPERFTVDELLRAMRAPAAT